MLLDATYTPAGPWVPTLPASPQCMPNTPFTPEGSQCPLMAPDSP